MNCQLARMLLAFPHADLAAEDRADLGVHVAGCPHCAGLAAGEAALHSAFARAMRAVPVPADLHAKLLREGFALRGAKHRREVYRWSALAATVMLTLGLGYGSYLHSRPELDTTLIAVKAEQDWERRDVAVREWLARERLPESLPIDFDYRRYVSHGYGELVAGHKVPMVVFQGTFTNAFGVTETQKALVYIVRTADYKNADRLGDAQASLVRIEVRYDPARPDLAYIVVYTGESIAPFLKRNPVSGT